RTRPKSAKPATSRILRKFKPSIASIAIPRREGGAMLIKRAEPDARHGRRAALPKLSPSAGGVDRRSFLRHSGLAAGALTALGTLSLSGIRKTEAGPPPPPGATVTMHKNVCTHCSVGCTVIGEVANGVWLGQEPGWDSPINRGSH